MSGEKEKTTSTASAPPPPSSSVPPPVEFCKGINGLDKVILRESRGSSAEVIPSLSLSLSSFRSASISRTLPLDSHSPFLILTLSSPILVFLLSVLDRALLISSSRDSLSLSLSSDLDLFASIILVSI